MRESDDVAKTFSVRVATKMLLNDEIQELFRDLESHESPFVPAEDPREDPSSC